MSETPAEVPEPKLIPLETLKKVAEQDDLVAAIIADRVEKVNDAYGQALANAAESFAPIFPAATQAEIDAAAAANDAAQEAESKAIDDRLQTLRDEDLAAAASLTEPSTTQACCERDRDRDGNCDRHPGLAPAVVEAQVAVGPEAVDEALAIIALLDNLEKELEALPLEDGVVRSNDPPGVEVSESLGFILFEGKSYSVCQPLKPAVAPEDPLFLIIEQSQGVDLRDSEKLLVFAWGLVRLKDRQQVSDNGKRVLGMIQAII